MNKRIWVPALVLALAAAGVVRAAPRVEADPNQDYPVTPDLGPWMICAAYFTGPSAPDLAHQLALQIRVRHNLPAYVFNYADEERKKQKALLERQQDLPFAAVEPGSDRVVPIPRKKITVRVEEQCAVMIGGFPDENAAHATLLAVKKLPHPDLNVPEGVQPFDAVSYQGREGWLNPFTAQSMVVRNPTVPHENQAMRPDKDPLLKTLNASEEYSMLRCPGKWTLAVKEYVGASMVQNHPTASSDFTDLLGIGRGRAGESLALAGDNAHKLAQMLEASKAGLQPFVLHTRTSSVVSVGAFTGPDDPAIGPTCDQIARWQQWVAAKQTDGTQKDPLGLFPRPVPIEVPHP